VDGTWSQAKALWWRNAWMLKCQRVILNPRQPSRYRRLRREPRSDGLSTIEAAAILIAGLEKRPEIASALNASFERMLARYREVQETTPELAPRPKPRPKAGFPAPQAIGAAVGTKLSRRRLTDPRLARAAGR